MVGGLVVVGVAVVAGLVAGAVVSEPRPEGVVSARAEDLTLAIQQSVNNAAWEQTGAVGWTFAGRNQHLWDRERHLGRVRWGSKSVLIDLSTQKGRAYVDGQEVSGKKADRLVERAWSMWCNDAFWLNPIAKMQDEGTTRSLVALPDGGEAVMVSYSSGGTTPGDAYLWIPGEEGRPESWRMWVSVIPIGGLQASWAGWQTLETGAMVATEHEIGPVTLFLTDVAGAASLAELVPGEDPFAPLL